MNLSKGYIKEGRAKQDEIIEERARPRASESLSRGVAVKGISASTGSRLMHGIRNDPETHLQFPAFPLEDVMQQDLYWATGGDPSSQPERGKFCF